MGVGFWFLCLGGGKGSDVSGTERRSNCSTYRYHSVGPKTNKLL